MNKKRNSQMPLKNFDRFGVIHLLREKCPNTDFSGLYFPLFGLNTEIYSVNIRIPSEYGTIKTRKNSIFEHFSHSAF